MLPVIRLYNYSASFQETSAKLRPGEIHIWKIACNGQSSPDSDILQSDLLPEETVRMKQFAHPKDKLRYALGHTTLRKLLCWYTECPKEEICIINAPHGKPYWKNPSQYPSVEFNLSHSGDWILLAFSLDYFLGVDTERIDTGKNLEKLAQRFYHPQEIKQYQNMDDSHKVSLFFHCWTIKEAYLKGLGEGLLHPTNEFYVNLSAWREPDTIYTIYSKDNLPTLWCAQHLPVSEGYVGTIAYTPR